MAATPAISRPVVGLPQRKDSFVLSAARNLLSRWHHGSNEPRTTVARTHEHAIPRDGDIKVICISDTHNTQPDLPGGDILIHAGDVSQYGMFDEIQEQLDWLNSQPHRWKIAIAGNHDLLLDPEFVKAHPDRELEKPGKERSDLQWGDIIYLNNSAVELEIPCSNSSPKSRTVTIFGSPLTPRFGNFAFQYGPKEAENHDIWEKLSIPPTTDILITHGPPFEHLDDGGKGCALLLKALWNIQPRLMVFGHIHPGRGQQALCFDDVVEKCYRNILLNNHPWFNLIVMFWGILRHKFLRAIFKQKQPHSGLDLNYCQLVNAAILGNGSQGKIIREPIITYI